MPNTSNFGAQTDNAVVQGTVTDRQMVIPDVPPQGLMSIGPRVTPNFVKEPWDKLNSYNFFDVVKDAAGSAYIAIKPVVPVDTELADKNYWFKWSDPNAQINELQEIVKLYDSRISQNTSAIERNESAIDAETERATAAEAKKAPINHASDDPGYGVGDSIRYGHVKLTDTGNGDSNSGFAATPKLATEIANTALHIKNHGVLMLGDSYAQGTGANGVNWQDQLEQMLDLQITYKLKDGSGGFTIKGTSPVPNLTYQEVIELQAGQMTQAEKDDVYTVVIQCGWNDSNSPAIEQTYSAASTCFDYIKNTFVNAKIYCAATYCGSQQKTSQYTKSYVSAEIGRACNKHGVAFSDTANLPWIIQNASTDTVHPSETTMIYVTGFIARLITHGYADDYTSAVKQNDNHPSITKDHCVSYESTQLSPNTEIPADGVIITAASNWNGAVPARLNVEVPLIYLAGDNKYYLGFFTFYVDGRVRVRDKGGYTGNVIQALPFSPNCKIKFH